MGTDASPARKAAAWAVHFYTGLGLPISLGGLVALHHGWAEVFFLLNVLAVAVDATDGALARAVKVKEVLPTFNGRKLDDIIDFLTFALLPAVAMPALGILPANLAFIAAIPLMASGYGFCQEAAKTDDAFVGFPSYWNIVVLYLYVIQPPVAASIAILVGFAGLVFVPIHYVYPTRTLMLRKTTLGLGALYMAVAIVIAAFPRAPWAKPLAVVSLAYVIYYFVISGIHHVRIHRSAA